MANQTKTVAEPGKQEVVITREFDAPRGKTRLSREITTQAGLDEAS